MWRRSDHHPSPSSFSKALLVLMVGPVRWEACASCKLPKREAPNNSLAERANRDPTARTRTTCHDFSDQKTKRPGGTRSERDDSRLRSLQASNSRPGLPITSFRLSGVLLNTPDDGSLAPCCESKSVGAVSLFKIRCSRPHQILGESNKSKTCLSNVFGLFPLFTLLITPPPLQSDSLFIRLDFLSSRWLLI